MTGLDRDNCGTIGFVMGCLFGQAISLEELRSWADHVIMSEENCPAYMIDLCQFDGYLKDIYEVIGFVAGRGLTEEERAAIAGIAYLRGVQPYDCPWSKEQAVLALKGAAHIRKEFLETFPFILLPGVFETVHTCTNWYDGPRQGIADYQGSPHLYDSEWQDDEDDCADTFLLSPVDGETFALAMEYWAIWLRWETAFHEGRVTLDSHPALPEERSRHEELKRLLESKLKIDPVRAVRKAAEFRPRKVDGSGGKSCPGPMEVRWTDP